MMDGSARAFHLSAENEAMASSAATEPHTAVAAATVAAAAAAAKMAATEETMQQSVTPISGRRALVQRASFPERRMLTGLLLRVPR